MSFSHLRGRLVALSLLSLGLSAEDAPHLVVTAPAEVPTIPWTVGPPVADAAAWLRDRPGLRAVRMGGHGLDPVIDGQGGSRVRVTMDGCPVQGGCPNRMDPPTSYAAVGAFDAVEVERGRSDVREAGGSAGAIRVERLVPRFSAEQALVGRIGGSLAGQGHARQAWGDASAGGRLGGIRAIVGTGRGEDYQNGSGEDVRAAWQQSHGTLIGAWRPTESQDYQVGGTVVRSRDMTFAGASMDAPTSDLRLLKGRAEQRLAGYGVVTRVYGSQVDHVMDNYSLRPLAAGAMAMRTETEADVLGGRLDAAAHEGGLRPGFGLDVEVQRHDGRRTRAASATATPILESIAWPDTTIRRYGGYGELRHQGHVYDSSLGVRLDLVESRAEARDGTLTMGRLTPRELYRRYYGTDGDDRREVLPAAVAQVGRRLGESGHVGLHLGRTQRAADINERYLAMNGSGMAPAAVARGRWVGNPDLRAEIHHQARLEATWVVPQAWSIALTGFADRVKDHILRDLARGQDGVLVADGATVYHRTEALYLGSGAVADWRCLPVLSLGATVDQVWAKDLASQLPLAQTPPLSGSAVVRGHLVNERLEPSLRYRWAARQDRVDDQPTGSDIDPGPTPGWAVVDLRLAWIQPGWGEVAVGVDNLLDRTYADHLAKASTFDPQVARVDEPGRSWWASAQWVH